MNHSSSISAQPITELDLALYSEGMLCTQRRQQVRSFLVENPQVNDFLNLDRSLSQKENGDARKNNSTGNHANVAPNELLVTTSSSSNKSDRLTKQSANKPRRRFIQLVVVASVLFACFQIGTQIQHVRASSALERYEQKLNSDSFSIMSPETQQMLLDLQADTHYLDSRENEIRRRHILARLYVGQAQQQLDYKNVAEFSGNFTDFPGIVLCNKAIEILTDLADELQPLRQTLVQAYYIKGQILYQFGISLRVPSLEWDDSCVAMYYCGQSLNAGLHLLRETDGEFFHTKRLQMGALFAKSIHKGTGLGESILLENGTITKTGIIADTASCFKELEGQIHPAGDPAQTVDQLCRLVASAHCDTIEQHIASIFARNTIGMRLVIGGAVARGIAEYNAGINKVESNPALLNNIQIQLNYGRLRGNLADALSLLNDYDAAIPAREKALKIFTELWHKDLSNEAAFELGWVTTRQIIDMYLQAQRDGTPQNLKLTDSLGALRLTSNNFKNFNGFQVGGGEVEMIHAIHAEVYNDRSRGIGAKNLKVWLSGRLASPLKHHHRKAIELVALMSDNIVFRDDPDFHQIQKMVADFQAAKTEK